MQLLRVVTTTMVVAAVVLLMGTDMIGLRGATGPRQDQGPTSGHPRTRGGALSTEPQRGLHGAPQPLGLSPPPPPPAPDPGRRSLDGPAPGPPPLATSGFSVSQAAAPVCPAKTMVVEPLAQVTVKLACQELGANYSLSDINDRVAILSGPRVMEIVHDGVVPSPYLYDLLGMLRQLPPPYRLKPMAVRVGDATQDTAFPILAKVRKIGQDKVALLPLNNVRHFGRDFLRVIYNGDPIPYKEKRVSDPDVFRLMVCA